MATISLTIVPRQLARTWFRRSFEWDPQDQYAYELRRRGDGLKLNLATQFGGCWDLVSLATGTRWLDDSSIASRSTDLPEHVRGGGPGREIGEKDEVNKVRCFPSAEHLPRRGKRVSFGA